MIPRVLALTMFDAQTISALAETIWRHHYAAIISPEQIDYMLAQRYQPALINEQVLNPEIWWRKLALDGMIIGFSCCMRTHKPGDQTAILAYQQYGFEITDDSVVDIGGGFTMNDYLMTLTKSNRWNT